MSTYPFEKLLLMPFMFLPNRRLRFFSAVLSVSWLSTVAGGMLCGSGSAIAATPTAPYDYVVIGTDLALQFCANEETTPSALLSLFDQTALSAAEREVRQLDDAAEKGDALHRIGASYACLGDVERAEAALSQVLPIAPEIEDEGFRATLLIRTAKTYKDVLDNTASMEAALAQALSIAQAMAERSPTRDNILVDSSLIYAELGDYEKLHDVVALAFDQDNRDWVLYAIADYLSYPDSAAERAQIAQLFPDFESSEESLDDATRLALDTYRSIFSLPQGLESAGDPSAALDSFIAEQTAVIEAFPNAYFQELGFAMLGVKLSDTAQPERAIPYLEQAAIALPASAPDLSLSAEPTDLDFTPVSIHLSVGLSLLQLERPDQGRSVIAAIADNPAQAHLKITTLLAFANAQLEGVSPTERAFLLAEAERLLPAVDSEFQQISQLNVAEAYLNSGNSEKARQLATPLAESLSAADDSAFNQLYQLPSLFVLLGDYERAVSIAQQFPDEDVLSRLPGELLSQQQEALALDVLDSFTSIKYRVSAVSGLMIAYSGLNRPEEALQLAESSLQQIQERAPLMDVAYLTLLEEADYLSSQSGFVSDSLRKELAIQVLYPVTAIIRNANARISRLPEATSDLADAFEGIDAVVAASPGEATQQRLIASIEDPTLRIAVYLGSQNAELALSELGNDLGAVSALDLPDYLLLRLVNAARLNNQLSQSILFIEAMRSPYARTIALSYLANTVDSETLNPEAINNLRRL